MSQNKPEYTRPRRRLTNKDLERVNLGRAFWKCNLAGVQDETVAGKMEHYLRNIVEMIDDGSGLVFTGARGVGKTGAAAVVLKEAVRRGFTAYFVTHQELRELQFNDRVFGDGRDGVTVSQKLLTAELLVIDDINEPFLEDRAFGTLHLERLVTRRNAAVRATVVTTRVLETIKEDHDSLVDVMSQTMVPMVIEGANLRDRDREALWAKILGDDHAT